MDICSLWRKLDLLLYVSNYYSSSHFEFFFLQLVEVPKLKAHVSLQGMSLQRMSLQRMKGDLQASDLSFGNSFGECHCKLHMLYYFTELSVYVPRGAGKTNPRILYGVTWISVSRAFAPQGSSGFAFVCVITFRSKYPPHDPFSTCVRFLDDSRRGNVDLFLSRFCSLG